jgi:hypothetical protein
MSEDYINQSGKVKTYADDRGGSTLYSNPIIGIVKNNIDLLKSGKIQVYLKRQNLPNQDNPSYWTTVSYMSPFFGYTPNTGSPNAPGDYVGNPNSYGFWATPPDIGTEVVCIFINGDPNFGYYIGCIPQPALTHMVPATAPGSKNVIPNEGESVGYGGASVLPVTEFNNANAEQDNSPVVTQSPRPIHSYQAAILNAQGLIRDTDRGVISSSSMRESPSRVFGMSTPGRPIYEGGYSDETISNAVSAEGQAQNYKVIGRRGGHSIVLDDGDLEGRDQLTRIRTAGGHMIMMNDYAQTLFIIHANGSSYIELGKEGTIDMYSTNSVNIRTQGDLNLHADNNININAAKDLNISGKNVHIESLEETTQYVGKDFKQNTQGNHGVKVDGKMSFASAGDSMIKSGGSNYLKGGPNIYLNTGESSLQPEKVKQLPIVAHTDTLRDQEKGYIPAPGKLPSIVTRAPAHMPWLNANQGVDVKTNLSADANLPAAPSRNLQQTNNSVSTTNITPTTPALTATVPQSVNSDSESGTSALVSQAAVAASVGPAATAVASGAGIVSVNGINTASIGSLGLNPAQLEKAGIIKAGSSVAVNALIQQGKPLSAALPNNVFTGKDGIRTLSQFVGSSDAQAKTMESLLDQGKTDLVNANLISGKESLTQTGGVILASAMKGTAAVAEFMKQTSSGAVNVPNVTTAAANLNNTISGSIESLVKSGNFAANLSDKATGTLGGVDVGDSLKGAAAGAFAKIKDTYKNLKANVPQILSGPATSSDVAQESDSRLPIPGGEGAVSNIVKAGGESISGALGSKTLSDSIKNIASGISAGLNGIKSKLTAITPSLTSKGDLTSSVTSGLPKNISSDLQGAIASLGSGGNIKAPTVALDTNDIGGLIEQSKNLLGNPKIPPLNFGKSSVVSANSATAQEYDTLSRQLAELDDAKFDERRKYLDAIREFGKDAGETLTAKATYENTLKEIEILREKLATLATSS